MSENDQSTNAPAANVQTKLTENLQITESDLAPQTGLLPGARDASGLRVKTLTPATIVTIDGIEMTVAQAEAVGRVRKNNAGGYEEANEASPEPKDDDNACAHFDAADEEHSNYLMAGAKEAGIDAVAAFAKMQADPSTVPEMVQTMAKKLGVAPEGIHERYDAIRKAIATQAYGILNAEGVDSTQFEAFGEWIRTHRTSAAHSAELAQYFKGDFSGWRHLAQEFLSLRGHSNAVPNGAPSHESGGKAYMRVKTPSGQIIEGAPSALRRAGVIQIA